MNKLRITSLAIVLALLLMGCGKEATRLANSINTISTRTRTVGTTTETIYIHRGPVSAADTRHVVIGRLPHLGSMLVNGKGYTLYAFVPDRYGTSACINYCAKVWPPIKLTLEITIDASPILDGKLVTTEPDPENKRVGDRLIKFAGRVLHTYVGDTRPRVATGEGLHSYGGYWYAVAPSGKLIVPSPNGRKRRLLQRP